MIQPLDIGYVVLKVRDLARSEAFYRDVLGFQVSGRLRDRIVYLKLGEGHHQLALLAVGPQAPSLQPHGVGLLHVGFRLASFADLVAAYRTLRPLPNVVVGMADHVVTRSLYLRDPDGNEIALYVDEPPERWAHLENPFAQTLPLDLERAAGEGEGASEFREERRVANPGRNPRRDCWPGHAPG